MIAMPPRIRAPPGHGGARGRPGFLPDLWRGCPIGGGGSLLSLGEESDIPDLPDPGYAHPGPN